MLSNRFPHRIIAQALCVGVCSFFVWLGLAYLLNGRLIVRWPSTDREAGSEIQIDGRILPMGIHEAIVYRLGPGRHQLGLKRPGFESQSQIVNVSSCSRTEFSPTWIAETKTAQSIEFDTISESARRLLDQLPFETEVKDQRRRLGKFYVEAKSPDLQKKIVELLDTLPSPWESHASLRIEALYAKPNTVWTIGEGKLRHSGAVTTLEMSSNRKQLISAGLDKEILVWDIDSGKQIRPSWTLTHPIRSMAISPDGSILAAACEDGGVHILNQKTGREQSLDRSNSLVQCLQFSRDGNILITGCADNRARIWRTENWQLVDQIPMSTRVSAIGFSIDDQKFAIGDFNGVVAIFDRKTKNLNRRVGGPPAKHLFFENKDEDLVSLGANREQGRWNLNEDRTAKNSFFPNVRAADRDGRWIIELDDRQSNIWLRIREPEERRSFQIGNHKPTAAFFDSTRNQLVIGTESGRILKLVSSVLE